MGDAVLCYEIKSERLIDLLEDGTDTTKREFRFGHPRIMKPEKFGLGGREDLGGHLFYADNGFPSVVPETLENAKKAGRILNPFGQRVPIISDAKMLLAEPLGKFYSDPIPSKSQALIRGMLGKVFGNIAFDTPGADLILHGHYLSNGYVYTPVKDLTPEFLAS